MYASAYMIAMIAAVVDDVSQMDVAGPETTQDELRLCAHIECDSYIHMITMTTMVVGDVKW